MYLHLKPRRLFATLAALEAFSQNVFCQATTTTATTSTNPPVLTPSAVTSPPPAAPYVHNLEVDFIFPRNETYKETDVFPVVFAFQGLAALRRTVAVIRLGWGIMPYTKGHIPGGIYYDDGRFSLPKERGRCIHCGCPYKRVELDTQR
ncbi:tRNA-guanine(15) transglycosylase-like protein [Apiospora arundinis]